MSPVIKEHARIGHAPSMSRLRSRARIEYEATSARASQAKRSQTPTTNRSAVHPSRAPGRMICALARADSDCGKPRSPSRLDVTFAVYDFLVLPCHLPAELILPPCTGARMRMKAVASGRCKGLPWALSCTAYVSMFYARSSSGNLWAPLTAVCRPPTVWCFVLTTIV